MIMVFVQSAHPGGMCDNTCGDDGDGTFDNTCDDGGPHSQFAFCKLGTDCGDCGRRYPSPITPPPAPPAAPPAEPPPPPAPHLESMLGIDMAVDVLSLLLLVCAVMLLWRFTSQRRARYEPAAGGSLALELGSVSHTTAGLRIADSTIEDPDTQRPVVLDHHAHEQLLDTQRQILVMLGDLTAEVRTLRSVDAAL